MFRKLCSILTALLFVAGFGLASTGVAQARNVVPHHGSYSGVDHHGRVVTFTFDGTQVSHFSVGHLVIGGAHVSRGMWHETCHNGYCTRGSWTSDGHVSGAWRAGGSSTWTSWTASVAPAVHPYAGTYMGSDHTGLRVHLSYHSGYLRGFTLDHNRIGDAQVSNRSFSVCYPTICFKGHWETEYYVVGSWRHSNSTTWRAWEAYAYAT